MGFKTKMIKYLLIIFILSGCTYNLNQKNLVDRVSEFLCRTEFEFQKIFGNNNCKLMSNYGCKIIIENYLPKGTCLTPQNDVKDFFETNYKEDDKSE